MERDIGGALGPAVPSHKATSLAITPARAILLLGLVLALLLAVPGETVTTRTLEPLFAIFNGIHRLQWGQVPGRDFHSALGPLSVYLPALFYRLSGSYGAAMPLAMALLVLGLAGLLAHIVATRLPSAIGLPFAAFLLLILAVPMNLGDGVTGLSFALFYNRIGWTGLAALLVMYLQPARARPAQQVWDAGVATLLTLVLLYSRASYGLVALAFLVFMLTDRRQWRWAAGALLATLAMVMLVELVWNGSRLYAADVLQALAAGGLIRGSLNQVFEQVLGNFADYLLLGLLAAFALWRRWSLRDALFYLFCAAAGFWLLNQAEQRWGIIAIHAAAVIASTRLLRGMERQESNTGPLVNPAGVTLYFAAFVFPTALHCLIALSLHVATALGNGGQPLALQRLQAVRLADLWTPGDFGASQAYLASVADGISALDATGATGRLFVLGGPDPFSVVLDLPPPQGDADDLAWSATLDAAHHITPAELLGDVQFVLERVGTGGTGPLGDLYRPYIEANFERISQTPAWHLWRRSDAAAPAAGSGQAPG